MFRRSVGISIDSAVEVLALFYVLVWLIRLRFLPFNCDLFFGKSPQSSLFFAVHGQFIGASRRGFDINLLSLFNRDYIDDRLCTGSCHTYIIIVHDTLDTASCFVNLIVVIVLCLSVRTLINRLFIRLVCPGAVGTGKLERITVISLQQTQSGISDIHMRRNRHRNMLNRSVSLLYLLFISGDVSIFVIYRIDIPCIISGIRRRIAVCCRCTFIGQ